MPRIFSDGDIHSRHARPFTSADIMSQCVMQVLMDGQLSVLSSSKSSSNEGRYSNLRFVAELIVGVVVAGVVAELVARVVPLVDVLGSGETGSM